MVDVSEKVLTEAKTKLADMTKTWTGGVCQGCCMDLEGKVVQPGHTACHSWVGYQFGFITTGERYSYRWDTKYKKDAEPFLVLTCHSKKRSSASNEATDAIILWMASDESPFSQFILNRDDKESLTRDGAIILSGPGGASHSQVMWMCKVLRYTTEGSKALDVWHTLYKGGVNPVLAVLICTYISGIKGATFSAAAVSGHVSVFGGYGADPVDLPALMRFSFNDKADSTSSLFKLSETDRKALDPKFGKQKSADTKIKSFCKPFEKDDGWGGKIKGEGVDGPELVRRVLEWQEELGGWQGAGFPVVPVVEAPPPLPTASTVYLDLDL